MTFAAFLFLTMIFFLVLFLEAYTISVVNHVFMSIYNIKTNINGLVLFP
jgi:hypothetical protein